MTKHQTPSLIDRLFCCRYWHISQCVRGLTDEIGSDIGNSVGVGIVPVGVVSYASWRRPVMTYKEQIEADAIREASALEKQGRNDRSARRHIREAADYNEEKFSRIFRK